LLFFVALLPNKIKKLDINGERTNYQVHWDIDRVVHHLALIDCTLEVFLPVLDFVAVQVDQAVVISDLDELLIADHEAVSCHLEYVDLLTDQTSELPCSLSLGFI
jgi:hypothetical protein